MVQAVRLDRTPGERRLAAFLAAAVASLLLLAALATAGVPPAVGLPGFVAAFVAVLSAFLVFVEGPTDPELRDERDRLVAVLPEAKRRWEEDRQRARAEREALAAKEREAAEPAGPPPPDTTPAGPPPPALVTELVPLIPPLAAGDWLHGDGSFPLAVVGESYHQRALEEVAGTAAGDDGVVPAVLRLEDNPYDRYAVSVVVAGRKVGHLSRADARAFRLRVAGEGRVGPEFPCRAVVNGGGRQPYSLRLDVRLSG